MERSFYTSDESWFDNVIQDFLVLGINQIDALSYIMLEMLFFFFFYFLAIVGEDK